MIYKKGKKGWCNYDLWQGVNLLLLLPISWGLGEVPGVGGCCWIGIGSERTRGGWGRSGLEGGGELA